MAAAIQQQPPLTVTVLGGGLAGMVAALELVKLGLSVKLYEAADRLGGKAGSDRDPPLYNAAFEHDPQLSLPEGVASDHGYHVFPAWYTNMRRLWREIGLDPEHDVYPGHIYYDLPPAVQGVRQPHSPKAPPTIHQLAAICELILQSDPEVDDLTLQAFLRSRSYAPASAPISLNNFILNALTIGDRDVSARVIRNVFRQWLPVFAESNWDALRGSLADKLIDPLERRIHEAARAAGAHFERHFGHRVTALQPRQDHGLRVTIESCNGQVILDDAERVVLALPPEVLRRLDTSELFRRDVGLSELFYLRSNPFSAVDVFCTERLVDLPVEHFTLIGSPHGITAFEISRQWPRLEVLGRTVLQFVAADSRGFSGLDDRGFLEVMSREIFDHLPDLRGKVAFYVPHRNIDVPLFVNDVGTWPHRPEPASAWPGVYFAGDYVRNATDVTSMEGAVRSGLLAAEALRVACLPRAPAVQISDPVGLPAAIEALIRLWPEDPMAARLECLAWVRSIMQRR
ncbi:MAG: FAD-dependent oxidoreductase [Gammaproteobacteria bacterium]|nr:FAD-dependent oxidoreductase [Gammaproteobacteria bacterium]